MSIEQLDPFDARLAAGAGGLLREFNLVGVLSPADVHVAIRLGRLAGEEDEAVLLAAALAVRAPRLGHVNVNLAQIRETAAVEGQDGTDLASLPWPEPETWPARLAASRLVGIEQEADLEARPLRLSDGNLYLDRYWTEERELARLLLELSEGRADGVDQARLERDLGELFDDADRQRLAAETAVSRRLSVIAGGPGTGKTTTVARIVALLLMQAQAQAARAPLIALAAPTGKAAARLEQAVHDEALKLAISEAVREQLLALESSTLHRLLGRRPDSESRFRHDRRRHLPYDVVIVDETSMVSLSLMTRLLEAIRPSARLVLVGDPGQLASIEAGAVLGDIVGPAEHDPQGAIGKGIVVLDRVHRFGDQIAALGRAVRAGDADKALEILGRGSEAVRWVAVDVGEQARGVVSGGDAGALSEVRAAAATAGAEMIEAARTGEARKALDALESFRLLCAHRRGPHGVSTWSARIESWLAEEIDGFDPEVRWYAGQPLLVTENDYELGLFNGDTGVVIAPEPGRLSAAFERRGQIVSLSPTRIGGLDTVFAMTIHKSQGSQFGTAVVALPAPDSRILTRELLYTAVTRARQRLIVAGSEESIRAAIERPVARASGLQARLWSS